MQRKDTRRRRGAEDDVESVLDELYATPPPDFVSRREELAVTARTAGRADDARRIHAARRPTRAAWAANLLLRSQPEESAQFLELGRALRQAHRTLDADGLKELSAQRRRIVAALSRQAAGLARDAGHPLSDAAQREVESTLRAVLADPDAADRWAGGRLETALTPPSAFPSDTATPSPGPRARPSRPAAPPPARSTRKDELAERRRKRREELARAEEAAEAAARRLRDRHAEHADADAALRRAREVHEQARQRVSDAERQLRQAQQDLERAERERRAAEERDRAATDALAGAEREAREAARHVDRLAARNK
ncbi:hypothetical protein GCM10010377_41070 [Streptomyces viridiviolaceus]|uniref:Uncharacterized protein n=1 Tax=Streptomyces viridiviolaceus TaxID=68282 RepID=A0ABW2E855_9ACTN|nr:hypothetical protein [Streptomyces viridiviolaceus]GHB45984.1 hypothetical protein GCM10010377_41070 [Streptomyces viridiviolaceus]